MTEIVTSLLSGNGWLAGILVGLIGALFGLWQGARASRAKKEAEHYSEIEQKYSERARRVNAAKLTNKEEERQQSKSGERDAFENNDI